MGGSLQPHTGTQRSMTSSVVAIRARIDPRCLTNKCKKDGCSVSLRCAPEPRVIIDLDRCASLVQRNEKRCDYLFIGGNREVVLAPMELKRGRVDASEVVAQLRAGVRSAKKVVPKGLRVLFRPVVAYGAIHKAERAELRKNANAIVFRTSKELVRLVKCSEPLSKALHQT